MEDLGASAAALTPSGVVLYARVSSRNRAADLDRQVGRSTSWALASGRAIGTAVTEIGLELDGSRKTLFLPLADPEVGEIIVEHR